jgi:hypothetical protein
MRQWSAGGGIELQEAAGGLPHARPANTHYKATPLPTTSGFLRYFRACSLGPVRQGGPGVPQGTLEVLWERSVCPLLGANRIPKAYALCSAYWCTCRRMTCPFSHHMRLCLHSRRLLHQVLLIRLLQRPAGRKETGDARGKEAKKKIAGGGTKTGT